MSIVVDSNLLVVLASGDPRAGFVERQLRESMARSLELHAPDLAIYEVANSLTQLIKAARFPQNRVAAA